MRDQGLKSCHLVDRKLMCAVVRHLCEQKKKKKGEKFRMLLFNVHLRTPGYVYRTGVSFGAKKSHIHGIYGRIALLEHLRTMTMHLNALLRTRRAIRVMHRNASSDSLSSRSVFRNFLTLSHYANNVGYISMCMWILFITQNGLILFVIFDSLRLYPFFVYNNSKKFVLVNNFY